MKPPSLLALLAAVPLGLSCLLPEEREKNGVFRREMERGQSTGIPVGVGNRFSGGLAPLGLGTRNTSLSTLLNVGEIVSGLEGLAKRYGIRTFTTPYTSHEGRRMVGAQIGGSRGSNCSDAYRVYLNGNMHARERGSADAVLYLVSDLLHANEHGVGLRYGDKSFTHAQVKTALAAGIVVLPLSNPDGVAYDQATGSCWRKNRNPSQGAGEATGVDINRNFDFLWDFPTKFAPGAQSSVASTDPRSETYHGIAPHSEPETRSVQWVLDTYARVRWYVDLHSYAGDVLYSWGSDENQSRLPYMSFLNATYDGVRGILTDQPGIGTGYGEFISDRDQQDNVAAARRMSEAMRAATGQGYGIMQSSALYPTSGASDDYAFSRHFADPRLGLVHAYTVEFGFGNTNAACPFYPTVAGYNENLKAVCAGLMEFVLAATDIGLGDAVTC